MQGAGLRAQGLALPSLAGASHHAVHPVWGRGGGLHKDTFVVKPQVTLGFLAPLTLVRATGNSDQLEIPRDSACVPSTWYTVGAQ